MKISTVYLYLLQIHVISNQESFFHIIFKNNLFHILISIYEKLQI